MTSVPVSAAPAAAGPWPVTITEPATGEVLAELTGGGAEEAIALVDAADAAFDDWSRTPADARAKALAAVAEALRDPATAEELAVLTARETGKRLAEARAEVGMSAGFFAWFAEAACMTGDNITLEVVPGISHKVADRPLGVVAVSTPWNFPLSIPARKIAAALAAGCTAVFKPSEVAARPALRLAEIVSKHLPDGVLGALVGEPRAVTAAWLSDHRVRALTFTGSTAVGAAISAQAAPTMTRCVLELGGNAPFVVLDDADPDQAAELLAGAKYRNNGQSCIAANVAWVPEALLDQVVEGLADRTQALRVGDPLDPQTTLGPLALPTDPARIEELVVDAMRSGAMVVRPSWELPERGSFALPAICVRPGLDARVVTEESFGPVLAVLPYRHVDEVIAHTRANTLGLAGYVVGTDLDRAYDVARRLDVGIVGVNTATPNTPQIPFGGLKASGLGWEGGHHGIDVFRAPQAVAVSR
jgi:succinate-semialdehyde dehydrogenase/glutarate-semialdehyde dehydrogenase